MATSAWGINRYVIRHHGTPVIRLILPLLVFAVFSVPAYLLYGLSSLVAGILLKVLLLVTFIIFTAWPERQFILQFVSKRGK
jgi:hypothetical protein